MLDNHVGSIHKIGLSKCPREYIDLFSQTEMPNNILLSENLPDIDEILSLIIYPEVLSIKSADTIKTNFSDNQNTEWKKVMVKIKINQKILYTSTNKQSVHVLENQCYLNSSVVVPAKIKGSDPKTLIKNKLLTSDVYVEDVSVSKLSKRSIFENIFMLIVLNKHKAFELCCLIHDNTKHSDIFMMFDDGTNMVQKTHSKDFLIKNMLWLPTGDKIVFSSTDDNSESLYLLDAKMDYQKCLIEPSVFNHIDSLCCLNNNIIFSAVKEKTHQIFSLNIDNLKYKQITFTDSVVESFNPKCSPDGRYIGFLRSISGVTDLWIINESGLECRKLTSSGHIKDFEWNYSSNKIVYVEGNGISPDKVIIKDLLTSKDNYVLRSDYTCSIKKIFCCPACDMFAFINSTDIKEDIFIYKCEEKQLINVTNNPVNTKIGDVSWDVDGNMLYYSANELEYFNIYCISLNDLSKHQLTNITASNIELSYRPKIM